jgi:hypothetical protein
MTLTKQKEKLYDDMQRAIFIQIYFRLRILYKDAEDAKLHQLATFISEDAVNKTIALVDAGN